MASWLGLRGLESNILNLCKRRILNVCIAGALVFLSGKRGPARIHVGADLLQLYLTVVA